MAAQSETEAERPSAGLIGVPVANLARSLAPAAHRPRRAGILAALVVVLGTVSLSGGGGPAYETPFFDRVWLDDVLAGALPDPLPKRDMLTLIAYLQLTGKFSERHAALFGHKPVPSRPAHRLAADFWAALGEEGYQLPAGFRAARLVSEVVTVGRNDQYSYSYTRSYFVSNCLGDAFKTANETLRDRRARYGAGSIELIRWIEAQIKIFDQCSGEVEFDPPQDPRPEWLPLERYDRQYQIAASYFYNGQHLEAASRFGEIGRTPDSPWRDLGRYLVGRSLAREAVVNENEPERHLQLALARYRELAAEPDYVVAFPSVPGQVRYVEAKLRPVALRRELEQRIIDEPREVSLGDLGVYLSLLRRAELVQDTATDFETWHRLATKPQPEIVIQRWRDEQSLPWLYLALAHAQARHGRETLTDLARTADTLAPETPGHFNMLLHRIRIRGLLGDVNGALGLAEDAKSRDLDRSRLNRLRTVAANATADWADYFRWAPLKALSLSWTDDFARQLPPNFNRITRDTSLFSKETTDLVNNQFTPAMILEIIDAPGLGQYLRGRLAIAGWTKAMLADDLPTALALANHLRTNIPQLNGEIQAFQQAVDKHFEAARIVFDHPAFSPWLRAGEGRRQTVIGPVRPTPDHIAAGFARQNWWCADYPDRGNREADETLDHPRFSRYSPSEMKAIREVGQLRSTAATTSFGPHVLRYAKDHLDDSRIPRTLHRLVFATRHACFAAPGNISQAAYALLHKHFPESEWADKTPYWYGRLQ